MGKPYERQSKVEAVRLALELGNTKTRVERDLTVGKGVISRWKRDRHRDGEQAFPGTDCLNAQDEEVRSLRCEVERLRRERDIITKAVATFLEDQK
ncbi:MAG: transposase [Thermodesulfobacteriota bacterium]|nr:transposase [Thermodesulfobacteriota bacterium]